MDLESKEVWLPIIEYSIKTGVSLSTIRRKIKSGTIPYRLEKGKYLILYGGESKAEILAPVTPPLANPLPRLQHGNNTQPPEETVRLVTDAFEYALKEKEERIRLLERRNRDLESHLDELRLLVQVLEEKYEVRY